MISKNVSLEDKSKVSSYRWVVWGILVAIYIIVFFHRLSVGVIVGDLKKSFGMNATQIANLGAMYFYAYTIMQIPTGILADHLGPKKTVITGCIVAAIGSITFSLSASIFMAYFSRLLVGLGVSVVFLSILKIQANWFPAKDFASMSGLTSFIGGMGGLLAQAPLIALVGVIGWRGSFGIMGIATVVLAILVIIFVKNTPTEKGLPEVNPQQVQAAVESQSILLQLVGIVKNPKIWGPAFAYGGINGCFLLFSGTFGVTYITSVYGVSKTYAANLISIAVLVGGISCLLIGKISDMLKNRKLPMITLASISTAAWVILVFAKTPEWFILIFVVLIGISGSIGVICWSVGKEVSNPKLAGMSMSIVNVCGFLFAAVLPIICGKFIDINAAAGLSTAAAYQKAFIVPVASSIIALTFTLLTSETRCENIYKG
ncbi:MFS transporter [Clostridium sp. OS1-26]|uniref:MFS transporter n=1 Tax=Clostridium sp. OS1-26 TaxID=3070681 RepID=UPI0027DFC5AC|nr:MFS transporter [Clostridium sp. OS1-26]WML33013.1 MFS transporter [Clostridium sp. OS1-26]